jgi:hypothetical protein
MHGCLIQKQIDGFYLYALLLIRKAKNAIFNYKKTGSY